MKKDNWDEEVDNTHQDRKSTPKPKPNDTYGHRPSPQDHGEGSRKGPKPKAAPKRDHEPTHAQAQTTEQHSSVADRLSITRGISNNPNQGPTHDPKTSRNTGGHNASTEAHPKRQCQTEMGQQPKGTTAKTNRMTVSPITPSEIQLPTQRLAQSPRLTLHVPPLM